MVINNEGENRCCWAQNRRSSKQKGTSIKTGLEIEGHIKTESDTENQNKNRMECLVKAEGKNYSLHNLYKFVQTTKKRLQISLRSMKQVKKTTNQL